MSKRRRPVPNAAEQPDRSVGSTPRRSPRRLATRLALGTGALLFGAAAVVYAVSEGHAVRRVDVPTHHLVVRDDSATRARGAHLVAARGCVGCHGADLAGRVELDEPLIGRVAGPNLTRGGRGAALTDSDWERAVRHGVRRDGTPLFAMPSQEHATMSDEDLGAIVAHARSAEPRPDAPPPSRPGPVLRLMEATGQVQLYAARKIDHSRPHPTRMRPAPTAEYGAYLASMCAGCHGERFGGGPIPGAPPGWKPAANLTPAGLGHYSAEDFVRALRTAVRPDGSTIDPAMPVASITRHMDDLELRALYAYLRTLPPRPYGTR